MQISCSIIDWSEAERRRNAGTLVDDLFDGDASWFYDADTDGDSDSALQYWAVGEGYALIAPHLGDEIRQHADATIGTLIPGENLQVIDDLNIKIENYFFTLSPERVKEIAEQFSDLDLELLRPLFDTHCSTIDRHAIRDSDEFIWYIKLWKSAVEQAAANGHGLIAHMG